MELFNTFMAEYGTAILYTIVSGIVTAIAGYFGIVFKNIYQKYVDDKTKKAVVETCVKATEQLYKDLHGDEKLAKCMEAASEMLMSKGIAITSLELNMLIESALAEFNKAFESKTDTDVTE